MAVRGRACVKVRPPCSNSCARPWAGVQGGADRRLDHLELLRAHDLLVLEGVEVLLQRDDLGLREQERRLRLVEELAVLDVFTTNLSWLF